MGITEEQIVDQIQEDAGDEPIHPIPPQGTEMSVFARSVYEQKYAWKDEEGKVVEDWADTAERVVKNVLGALGYTESSPQFQRTYALVRDRKLMPGGRYLYASGRPLHQVQNCLLMKA